MQRTSTLLIALLVGLLLLPGVASAQDSAEICDADGLVEAVQGGPEEGTLEGMADDPVGTAASSNPILTTLVTALVEAQLVDTLNGADALTVLAPTDCAFANFDQATLEAALADPAGLLTSVLGYHVIAGEQIAAEDLSGEYETFTGEVITINGTDVDGQASILVPDISTANATVHLIDQVLVPPSAQPAEEGDADEEMTDEEMTDEEMTEEEMTEEEAADDDAAEEDSDDDAPPSGGVATGAGGTAGGTSPVVFILAAGLAAVAAGAALVWRRS